MNKGRMFNKSFQSRFQVYLSVAQLIPNAVGTRINFDAVQFDPLDEYDEAVLYQFVPIQAGYYYLEAGLQFVAMGAGTVFSIDLADGVNRLNGQIRSTLAGILGSAWVSRFAYLTPASTIWVQAYQASGGGVNLSIGNTLTWFNGFRVG